MNPTILMFNEAKSYELGKAAIQFCNKFLFNTEIPSITASWYALNSFRDGWFRVNDQYKITYSIGLKIREFAVSGRKAQRWGQGFAIKACLTYETPANTIETTRAWLYVEDCSNITDVLKYIEDMKELWVD